MKNYEDLQLQDDFVFGKVMQNNVQLCKKLLEMILKVEISEITYIDRQKDFKEFPESKGIRIDVMVQDAAGNQYLVEMQATDTGNLPMRTRYYHGTSDVNTLRTGKEYEELPKNIVIFLCTFDLFHKGNYIYEFPRMCRQCPGLELEDGSETIFINATGDGEDLDEEMRAFLRYLSGGAATTDYTDDLEKAVRDVISHPEWRKEYMTLQTRLMDARREGFKEGKEEGRQEERLLTQEIISALQEDTNANDEDIAKLCECDVQQVMVLRQAFNRCNNMEKRKGAGE